MRIPFDSKYRDKIESGEYKVETRYGCSARIVCWDRAPKENNPKDLNLCVLIEQNGGESIYYYHTDGTKWVKEECFDLFIVTPEPEMSEFENGMLRYLQDAANKKDDSEIIESTKEHSPKLLTLAKHQLLQSGELLSQEHHEKLMETLNKAHEEELEKAYKNADEVQYRKGREDALKDLPRWRTGSIEGDRIVGLSLYHGSKWIPFFDLEKLPGFNDEDHE